jgi:hypothetical protein
VGPARTVAAAGRPAGRRSALAWAWPRWPAAPGGPLPQGSGAGTRPGPAGEGGWGGAVGGSWPARGESRGVCPCRAAAADCSVGGALLRREISRWAVAALQARPSPKGLQTGTARRQCPSRAAAAALRGARWCRAPPVTGAGWAPGGCLDLPLPPVVCIASRPAPRGRPAGGAVQSARESRSCHGRHGSQVDSHGGSDRGAAARAGVLLLIGLVALLRWLVCACWFGGREASESLRSGHRLPRVLVCRPACSVRVKRRRAGPGARPLRTFRISWSISWRFVCSSTVLMPNLAIGKLPLFHCNLGRHPKFCQFWGVWALKVRFSKLFFLGGGGF